MTRLTTAALLSYNISADSAPLARYARMCGRDVWAILDVLKIPPSVLQSRHKLFISLRPQLIPAPVLRAFERICNASLPADWNAAAKALHDHDPELDARAWYACCAAANAEARMAAGDTLDWVFHVRLVHDAQVRILQGLLTEYEEDTEGFGCKH